ncbi:TRAFAC clade GTPase domain-containing protein [Catenibacterium mitsuokai]|uniref:TRAFAC clade GTPase domain-containing protein n=1 Tax=Catenibacterium mitsuokai TaxID=100886 RepID=UPI003D090C6C
MKESWKKIRCPYCFEEFAHDEVHFRIAEGTCEYAKDKSVKKGDTVDTEKFSRFLKSGEIDQKFEKVWGSSRGGMPDFSVEDLFYVPWVDQSNKADMIVGDYITDADGFVEKIEDKCSHLPSYTRICPNCHNKLPLHYGKNPQKFISVLGVSASGKTVYLKQLLSKLTDSLEGGILSHVNGSYVDIGLPVDDESSITLDKPLPDSTKDLNFKIPNFITLTFKKDNVLTTYDFVIYDVAGEILVNLAKNNRNKFDFFAGYIKKSDAIITLIEPKQLVSNPRPEYPASEMISTLYKVFGGQVQVPTAITISKSDLLLSSEFYKEKLNPNGTFFNENSIITKNIPWDSTKKYFYADVYTMLSAQLRKFYTAKANPFYESVNQQIADSSFFAVSSLFDGVDQKLIFELASRDEWNSNYVDSLIKKFPFLTKKLKEIKTDLEDQEANPDDSIIDANNIIVRRSFIFDQIDENARRLDEILSKESVLNTRADIREAVYEQFDEDEVIDLIAEDHKGDEKLKISDLIRYISYKNETMEGCSFNIRMQGYPRGNGDLKSLRIEEPFFWLLCEMGIINRGDLYTQNTQKGNDAIGLKSSGSGLFGRLFGGKRK